jgi:hypothetical protein
MALVGPMPVLDSSDVADGEVARYRSVASAACFLGSEDASMTDCCSGDQTKLFVVLSAAPADHVVKAILRKVEDGAALIADGSLAGLLLHGGEQDGTAEVLVKLGRDRAMKSDVMRLVLRGKDGNTARSRVLRGFLGLDGDMQILLPASGRIPWQEDCRYPFGERIPWPSIGIDAAPSGHGKAAQGAGAGGFCGIRAARRASPVWEAYCAGNVAPVLCAQGVNADQVVGMRFSHGKGSVFLTSLRSSGWPRQWDSDARYAFMHLVLSLLPEVEMSEVVDDAGAPGGENAKRLNTGCLALLLKQMLLATLYTD